MVIIHLWRVNVKRFPDLFTFHSLISSIKPVFWIRIHLIRIPGSCILGWIPSGSIQDLDPGFWWPKNENKILAEKNLIFLRSKVANYLSQGRHKGRPSYRGSLQPSKENIQHFKTWNLFICLFLWVVFALLDPDSESGTGSTVLIESGSETLDKTAPL